VAPDDLPAGNVSVISKFICVYRVTQKSLAILQIIGLQVILELERMCRDPRLSVYTAPAVFE